MSRSLSISDVVRGGFWLYTSSIVNNLSGFFYWMVISATGGPGVVGVVSAVVGFASLIVGLLNLGVGVGSQRFYGLAIGRGDRVGVSRYFWSVFFYALTVYGIVSLCIIYLGLLGYEFSGLSSLMLMFCSVFILFGV
ncbi:MAG: hypothetical protein DRO40_10320, partial [Thermoprotei archaeon]